MRGISFKIPQSSINFLSKILKNIDIGKYYWYNVENQTEILNNSNENNFLKYSSYKGTEFLKCINLNYSVIFLKLQTYRYPDNFFNIHTYSEFIKSNCQMIVLVYDCEYVEIYSKNQYDIQVFYKNAIDMGYNNVEYITESNDQRISMDIL